MPSHVRTLACALGLLTLVAACGGSSDAQQIEGLIPSMRSAMSQGDWSEACSDMSYQSQSQVLSRLQTGGIDATSCAQALSKAAAQVPGFAHAVGVSARGLSISVNSVVVHADQATARVEAKARGRTTAGSASFVRQGGRCRLRTTTPDSSVIGAFSRSGSGSSQGQVLSRQEQSALAAVKASPNSAAAWSQLLQARWASAAQGANFNQSTNSFTTSGKQELTGVTRAWQRYRQLTRSPDPNLALIAARAYAFIGNDAGAASAWEVETAAKPDQLGYECLAATAYAAGQTEVGALALNKALSLAPKSQQAAIRLQINTVTSQPSVVQQAC